MIAHKFNQKVRVHIFIEVNPYDPRASILKQPLLAKRRHLDPPTMNRPRRATPHRASRASTAMKHTSKYRIG